jgi:hypothetical protein
MWSPEFARSLRALRADFDHLSTAPISISTLAWRFSAHRMVMDYARLCYVPAAGGLSSEMTIH